MIFKLLLPLFLFLYLSNPAGAQEQKISLGVIAPMTGNQAQIGKAIENGLKLAQEDFPDLFKPVELILEDSEFNNRTAISALRKLTEIDKVRLVYVFGHGQSHALAPVAESLKVPLIACTGEKEVEAGREYIIRFFVPHEWLGHILFKYLKAQGYSRFGIIKAELSFIENIYRGFNRALGAEDTLDIVEVHSGKDTDFRTSIMKAKSRGFDALGVFLGQGQIAPFYHQLKQLRFDIPTFGTHAFESSEEIKQAGDSINGVVLPAITASSDFKARYRKAYGHETFVAFAANVYDFAVLGAELSLKHKTSAGLLQAIKNTTDKSGAGGRFGYRQSKDFGSGFIFPVAMKQIRDGKLVELKHFVE